MSYELQITLPDGSRRWHEWTDRGIFDETGRLSEYQSVGRDITERKRAEQQARHLAQHDPLTNLPNRALLEDHLQYALGQARRDQRQVAVLLLDLDGFKRVNDTLGHLVETGCCARWASACAVTCARAILLPGSAATSLPSCKPRSAIRARPWR